MSAPPYRLEALTPSDVEAARGWRNAWRESLRTPFLLTEEMQRDFYQRVVCNREGRDRYWAVREEGVAGLAAMAGLTGIQWENGVAEISLIVDPTRHGRGVGTAAVALVLEEAFQRMRLLTVVGEVYQCNVGALDFWRKVTAACGGSIVTLPRRKWWNGCLWDALWFTIAAEGLQRRR